jgi:hypothetical protein
MGTTSSQLIAILKALLNEIPKNPYMKGYIL